MKKRAIISAVAGIALAGVMAVGFAACGGESAKSIKGDEVDKATWETAMDVSKYDNYKAVYTSETVTKMGEVTVTTKMDCTITYVDGNQHIEGKNKTTVKGDLPAEAEEYYKDGEVKFDYYINKDGEYIDKNDDGKWEKVTVSDSSMAVKYPVSASMMNYFISDKDFDHYEYNKDQKGYVLKDAKEGRLYVVKIKDGKFKAYYAERKDELGENSLGIVVTHGGQSVSVPEVS